MTERKITLRTIDAVKNYVGCISQYPFAADLISGRYVVDAKSIMGIFSLDLSNPITMQIHYENEKMIEEFLSKIENFLVNE